MQVTYQVPQNSAVIEVGTRVISKISIVLKLSILRIVFAIVGTEGMLVITPD